LGNEEEFLDPILFDSLLERVHADILSAMISLMLLAVILIRLNPISFSTAILSQVALLLAPSYTVFIAIWIILFLLWHLLAFLMGFSIMWKLLR